MGFFDIFKKDKKKTAVPSSFQKVQELLFPNGDQLKQIEFLQNHFGNKYEQQEISENLIFILSGYLLSETGKTRDVSISKVLDRPRNRMSREEIEFLHDYALKNHPKLSLIDVVTTFSKILSEDGCNSDILPGANGQYGFSPNNPIPTDGIMGIYDYLSRLYIENQNVTYVREMSVSSSVSKHPVDKFYINSHKGKYTLYFSGYQRRTSQLAPNGFILVDNNNFIISSSNLQYPAGYKLSFVLLFYQN